MTPSDAVPAGTGGTSSASAAAATGPDGEPVGRLALAAHVPRIALRWMAEEGVLSRRVDGSLLFADISGFTNLSERLATHGRAGAEEVVSLVGNVLRALIDEIEDRGGDVLIFAGDALIVLFDGDAHAARAARAAAAIRHWFSTHGVVRTSVGRVALRVSIGVASGPVDLVLAGGDEQGLFVAGPTTTTMVLMERAATAGEILVGAEMAAALDPGWVGDARDGGHLLRRSTALGGSRPTLDPLPDVDPSRLVPAPVRRFLTGGADGFESEHRLATIAFVIAGGLDARLVEDSRGAAADLDALFRAASASASRLGVTLLGTDVTADGVTLFLAAGAPVATGDDEERMLHALREILTIPQAARLRLRAGVNRGPVFAGDVGAPHRRTYTAMGDTTNLAARLAARAAPGQLLATADVLARSAVEFVSEALPAWTPKGKHQPVVPYLVGAAVGRRARMHTRLPLAGRGDELELLKRALTDAVRGAGNVVAITGEPGSGKSRLVQELLLDERIAAPFVARFTPAGEGTPYGGLQPALRGLAGIAADVGPQVAGERLTDWVDALAPELRPWLPLLAIPFGATIAETPESKDLAPEFRRERLHGAMSDLLGASLRRPAVLVFDDLHWADEASVALLESVVASPASHSRLVLALSRPGPRSFGGPSTTRLDLVGLDHKAVTELACAAAAGSPLSDAELVAIVGRAGGNPLFARELAAVVAERGSVEALPDRLESLLSSRIDRLSGSRRALLRRAAVLGRTVDLELLGEVLADDRVPHEVSAWRDLDEFVVWEDPGRVRFRHDLIRDVAYEGLPHARRRVLHARLARAIERRAAGDTDEAAAVLALNFALGGQPEPAFRYARRAGDLARSRYANVDASGLYRRALECAAAVDELPAREVAEVAEALGDVAELAGRYTESVRAYARAGALMRAGDTDANALPLARLARKRGIVCERSGHYGDALRWYARGRRLLADATDQRSHALGIRLELDRAGIRFRQGKYRTCARDALEAARGAERIGDRALQANAYYLLQVAYGDLGSPEVVRYRHLALPIYEELGDLIGQGNVLNNLGIDAYFEGRWEEALALYARSKDAKTRAGDVANAATQSNNESEILSDQGRLAEAEALLTDTLRVWGAAGYEIGVALATSNLGRAAARAGRHDEGLARLEDATGKFARIGAHGYVDETRTRIAECLALAGRSHEAEAVARATLASVRREAGTSILGAQLERTLGWCSRLRGDSAAACLHFESSLAQSRALGASFEVALTLRAMHGMPATDGSAESETRARDEETAAAILADLGVIRVAEPRLPGGEVTNVTIDPG